MFTGNSILNYLIQNISLKSTVIFMISYFFVIWISIIIWVIKDITNRTDSLSLQIISVIIVFIFGPLGIFIYLLIRPGKTLMEKSYEEIEQNLEILMQEISERNNNKKEKKNKKNNK